MVCDATGCQASLTTLLNNAKLGSEDISFHLDTVVHLMNNCETRLKL